MKRIITSPTPPPHLPTLLRSDVGYKMEKQVYKTTW